MPYGSPKVMSREKTLDYLYNKYLNKERLIVSRYNDGEYQLMTGQETKVIKKQIGVGSSLILKDLLLNSIKNKKQLVCTADLGTVTELKNDYIWYKTQTFVIENSNHELYGCSNWATYDFRTKNKLISLLFSDKTLIVSGICEFLQPIMLQYNRNIVCYQTPNLNAEKNYSLIKKDLLSCCKNFKHIILACGPLSKVLLVDLIDECDAHLIDFGSLVNAICRKEDMWTMSWARQIPLQEYVDRLLGKIKNELD